MSARPAGWESDKRRFFGQWGSTARPAAVLDGRLSGTTGKWLDGMAALQTRVVLAPGASREIVFTLGQGESRAEARRLARRYHSRAAVETAWRATRRHWDRMLEPLEVSTPIPRSMSSRTRGSSTRPSCRLLGRTGYWQMGGAYGFRRSASRQPGLAAAGARTHTRADPAACGSSGSGNGTAWHWWHPLTEEGARKPLNDDLLWLPFVTLNYLRETLDWKALDERCRSSRRPAGPRATSARSTSTVGARSTRSGGGSRRAAFRAWVPATGTTACRRSGPRAAPRACGSRTS